ncbi:MAG: SDR family NAD(P)-dependent oxidoreductase, partial [Chloroflexota bacterium]
SPRDVKDLAGSADHADRAGHVSCDLTDPSAADRMLDAAQARYGPPDILVNNAAEQVHDSLPDTTRHDWIAIQEVNVVALGQCMAVAAQLMRRRGGGAIVNLASIAALRPGSGSAVYAASKAAVIALTKAAAVEFGPEVRINAVSPGLIDRPGLRQEWAEGVRRYETQAPLRSIGRGEDIANACLFLCSPLARWITGANLVVDGGATLV